MPWTRAACATTGHYPQCRQRLGAVAERHSAGQSMPKPVLRHCASYPTLPEHWREGVQPPAGLWPSYGDQSKRRSCRDSQAWVSDQVDHSSLAGTRGPQAANSRLRQREPRWSNVQRNKRPVLFHIEVELPKQQRRHLGMENGTKRVDETL